MASRIRFQNEHDLGYLRELSRHLTVNSCTASDCLKQGLARIESDRPEIKEALIQVITQYTKVPDPGLPRS